MILGINIQNTRISIGVIDNSLVVKNFFIYADRNKTIDEYSILFKQLFLFNEVSIDSLEGAIISSVVPELTAIISKSIYKLTNLKSLIVGAGVKTGLNIKIDNPAQLGSDLVSLSVGATLKYKSSVLIIDLGSATTFVVVDKDSNIIGASIAPGVGSSLVSLTKGASLLPVIELDTPRSCIGTNTQDSMKSGLLFGFASLIDGMINKFEKKLGYNLNVISTGEFAKNIIPLCEKNIEIDNMLVFKGLENIYLKNKK